MAKIDQFKILDNKIRANKVQYDLDREAAKISALSSGELEKYEYLSGENLGYKPDVIQKAKYEYSSLSKVFNEGLDKSDKKEGLLKRLKNIDGKKEQQLQANKNQEKKKQVETTEDEDEDMETFHKKLRSEIPKKTSIFDTIIKGNENENAIKEAKELNKLSNKISYDVLSIPDKRSKDKNLYDFNEYAILDNFAFIKIIHYKNKSLEK